MYFRQLLALSPPHVLHESVAANECRTLLNTMQQKTGIALREFDVVCSCLKQVVEEVLDFITEKSFKPY